MQGVVGVLGVVVEIQAMDHRIDHEPVFLPQPRQQRIELALFAFDVPAQAGSIGARLALHGLPRQHRAMHDSTQVGHQPNAGSGHLGMLAVQRGGDGGHRRLAAGQPLEGQVFPGMVKAVGVARHVMHDVQHQVIVRPFAALKQLELRFQQFQQADKVGVLALPFLHVLRHDASPSVETSDVAARQAATRQKPWVQSSRPEPHRGMTSVMSMTVALPYAGGVIGGIRHDALRR